MELKLKPCRIIETGVKGLTGLIESIIEKPILVTKIKYDDFMELFFALHLPEVELELDCCQCGNCFKLDYICSLLDDFFKKNDAFLQPLDLLEDELLNVLEAIGNKELGEKYLKLLWQKENHQKYHKKEFLKLAKHFESFEINIQKLYEHVSTKKTILAGIENNLMALSLNYLAHQKIDLHDLILDNSLNLLSKQIFDCKDVEISNKIIVYFDQHIFDIYDNDQKFERLVEKLKEKGYLFTYSPYTVEEALKYTEKEWQESFFKTIRNATNCNVLIKENCKITIKNEDPKFSMERARILRVATKAAQDLSLIKAKENRIRFPQFFCDKHTSKISGDLKNFKQWIAEHLNRGFSEAMDLCFSSFTGQNLIDAKKNHSKQETIVYDINSYLNLIGFKRDSEEKKIMNNYFDTEHINYGRGSHFFITNDKKLKARANLIYEVLEINTKALTIEEFYKITEEV